MLFILFLLILIHFNITNNIFIAYLKKKLFILFHFLYRNCYCMTKIICANKIWELQRVSEELTSYNVFNSFFIYIYFKY